MTTTETNETETSGTIAARPLPRSATSGPRSIRYHAVDDRELDRLVKFEQPLAVALAAVFVGLFLGTAYPAMKVTAAIMAGSGSVGLLDLLFLIVCAASLGAGVAMSFVAARGRSEVVRTLHAIRERGHIGLPRGHPSAPIESESAAGE